MTSTSLQPGDPLGDLIQVMKRINKLLPVVYYRISESIPKEDPEAPGASVYFSVDRGPVPQNLYHLQRDDRVGFARTICKWHLSRRYMNTVRCENCPVHVYLH